VWLNYYAARMRLARELGTMKLDQDGHWIDHPVSNSNLAGASDSEVSNLPPVLPSEWIDLADSIPQEQDVPAPIVVKASEDPFGDRPVEVDSQHAELVKEIDHVD